MRAGGEPVFETFARLRNSIGPRDAAGIKAEFLRALSQALTKILFQKSRSA
jgi:hypothetical protein